MLEGNQRSPRIDNTIRYDSPNWSGFHFGASYSLGGNTDSDSMDSFESGVKRAGADNDGYGIMLGYDNGPLALVGNWSRLADSKDSSVWNLGAAYRFGPAKVELVYQQTKDNGWAVGKERSWKSADFLDWVGKNSTENWAGVDTLKEKQWLLGLEWKLGPGRLNA